MGVGNRTARDRDAGAPAIVSQLKRLAGGRELYLGPLGLAATFDSWSPPELARPPRRAWNQVHRRDGSVFACAWLLAAIARLVPLGPARICAGTTIGPAGVVINSGDGYAATPRLRLHAWLAELAGEPVTVWSRGESLTGLAGASTLLAVIADGEVALQLTGASGAATLLGAGGVRSLEGPSLESSSLESPGIVRLPGNLRPATGHG